MASIPKRNLPPVDPETNIPPAVRRAAEAADAAMRANNPPPPAPASNDTITIAPPEPPQRLPNAVTTTQPAPPAPPQPEPPPQPQPQPPNEPQVSAEEWQRRFNAMQGRYRDATKNLNDAVARIEALETMLATTQRQPAPQPQPQTKAKLITEKDEQDVGAEMIDLMRRAAREELGSVPYNELMQEVQELRARVNGTAQTMAVSAKQTMHNLLDRELPNWKEINVSEDFHAWLALRDKFSGVTRSKLLTDAYQANEGERVLSIFQGFVSDTAADRPADPQTSLPPPPATQPHAPSRPTLEELAAPGRARTAASPTPPAEKQIITTNDVNAFYADVRRGVYRGREDEQRRLENELFVAMRENRVVQSP